MLVLQDVIFGEGIVFLQSGSLIDMDSWDEN